MGNIQMWQKTYGESWSSEIHYAYFEDSVLPKTKLTGLLVFCQSCLNAHATRSLDGRIYHPPIGDNTRKENTFQVISLQLHIMSDRLLVNMFLNTPSQNISEETLLPREQFNKKHAGTIKDTCLNECK